MTTDKLKRLHEQEDELNKQIGALDKQLTHLKNEKTRIAKKISKNMRLRNDIVTAEINAVIERSKRNWAVV